MKNNRYYPRRNRFRQNNDKQNHFSVNNRQVLDFANGLNYRRRGNNKTKHPNKCYFVCRSQQAKKQDYALNASSNK